ncbi:MAG: DUF58 domain-containing protein [Chloroflexota bacterium]|nr:DUF58 domain-containing protein [Chloroflexota bacterium]MDQ5867167.1 DUF58 domain-containing protein [Chloroflexota bacterium]
MRPAGGIRASIGNLGRRFARRAPIFAPVTDNNVVDGDFLRKLDRLSLTLGRDLINGLMGEHLSTRRTSGIEFADYRQYSAGDDLRRVDWNAYARLGTLHVRQAQAEHDTVLFLLVDASPSMDFGTPTKFLSARRLAAGLGYIALSHLDSVVLAAPGADNRLSADPFRGRGQSPGLFRTLQDLNAGQATDFDGIMRGWSAERMGGGAVGRLAVIISDLLLDGWRDGVRNLVMNGFNVTVLHVLSPEELAPSEDGDFQLEDSETGERLDVHLGAASLQEYDRRIAAWLAETETWCDANAARYVRLQSDWDIERTLLDLLRKRGVTA